MLKTATLPTKKKLGSNKFVLGFAALAATAVVGATGIAAAQTPGSGYGYGGSTNTGVNVNVNGNNNVIHVILNIFR
jgi:3D (Asp-Asp-Asp) domain-containing protein